MSNYDEQEPPQTEFLKDVWETQFEVCDICNNSAYFVVTLSSGKLFFCYHDYNANKEALVEVAEEVLDESKMLN